MAWIDDRIYAHPKWLAVSPAARGVYASGLAYASGWSTGGRLDQGALRMIECTPKLRRELVTVGLWDEDAGVVIVHDWDTHNGKRDARKKADRERKKRAYREGRNGGVSAGERAEKRAEKTAETVRRNGGERAENREESRALKEVKEVTELKPRAVTSKATPTRANGQRDEQPYDFNIDDLFPDPLLKDIP